MYLCRCLSVCRPIYLWRPTCPLSVLTDAADIHCVLQRVLLAASTLSFLSSPPPCLSFCLPASLLSPSLTLSLRIGNLGDITLRAVEVLRNVDVVASEDTRRTSRLLKHLQLPFTKLISHHEHNWKNSAPEIVAMAQAGQSIALVSDAGTPGICDPGTQLIDACIKAGVRVEPIPGACAAAAAVSVAAMAVQGFAFLGFIPPKGTPRQKAMAQVASSSLPVVIYEAPHRVLMTLRDLASLCGNDRQLLVARELTKVTLIC